MATDSTRHYRVRRVRARCFLIQKPNGDFIVNSKDIPIRFPTHREAVTELRLYERGKKFEPHLLIDFEDMANSSTWYREADELALQHWRQTHDRA